MLIRRFLDGDERSFRALYQRHTPRLRAIVMRLLGARKQETEDTLQDTWLAAARGIHTFRGDARFSTWLTTIAIRAARTRLFTGDVAFVDFVDETHGTIEQPNVMRIDLERAIERLADHQRLVLVLFDIEGFTHGTCLNSNRRNTPVSSARYLPRFRARWLPTWTRKIASCWHCAKKVSFDVAC